MPVKRMVAAILLMGLAGIFAMPYFRPFLAQYDGYDANQGPDEMGKTQSSKIQQITFTHCPPFVLMGASTVLQDRHAAAASAPHSVQNAGVHLRYKTGRDPPPSFKSAFQA